MSLSRVILIIITLLVIIGTGVFSARRADIGASRENGKIVVVTTLFPLYDMVRAIGGDSVDVSLLVPPGTETHSYEPTPSDIVRISQANIFIYTGPAMEPWVKDLLAGIHNPDLIVVNASEHLSLMTDTSGDTDHGGLDPHVWLDPENTRVMATDIAHALITASPSHTDDMSLRLGTYTDTLTTIDAAYATTLASCTQKTIIYGGHYAFGYLAHRYGLDYIAAQGFSPDAEPTASDLATLSIRMKELGATAVFYDPLESQKLATTIADETHAALIPLQPGHTVSKDAFQTGVTFFDILRSNLDGLRTGLSCTR